MADRYPGMIFVYGPPGSGKSTVGAALAQALELPFSDLDAEVENAAGRSIAAIFQEEGEPAFRRLEREALLNTLSMNGERVVALGGGALLDPDLRERVIDAGRVLLLGGAMPVLKQRVLSMADQRPLLHGDAAARLESLLAEREAHYASFPLQVDTSGKEVEKVAWEAQVALGRFRVRGMGLGYDVRVRPGGLDRLGELLGGDSYTGPLALVSDSNVGPLYAERVRAGLRTRGAEAYPINFPAGEAHKTLDTLRAIWSELVAAGVERGGMVLALGGGVVTDLAGFAAAAYLRGVPWAVLPTSLLGMVDASLGGKTGADLPQGKNLVGAFHAPRLVLADPATLNTLPQVELRSGIAEVVKAGVIADPELFSLCARGWGAVRERLDEVLCRAMAVKVRLIQADPYEQGPRMALNLGHTIGHGVEKASGYRLSHGQSVAIGMVAEARLAEMMGLAQPPLAVWIIQCLAGLGLPTEIPPDIQRDAILQAMRVDKKRAAGVVRFSLPARLGEVRVGVEFKSLEAALASLTDN